MKLTNVSEKKTNSNCFVIKKQYAKISSFLPKEESQLLSIWEKNDWIKSDWILGALQKFSWYYEQFLEHMGIYIVLDKNCFLLGGADLEIKRNQERQFVLAFNSMLEDTFGNSPSAEGKTLEAESCQALCQTILKFFHDIHSSGFFEHYAYHEFLKAVKNKAYENVYVDIRTYEAVTKINE